MTKLLKGLGDNMKVQIRLSGSGGQGVILAGIILAEAGIKMGLNAVQSQSYGPEARGGSSKAEVIIKKDEIFFTKVIKPDIFLALTQDSFNKYGLDLADEGIIVVDEDIDTSALKGKVYKLPIITTARDVMERPMVANIIALGAISQLIDGLDEEMIQEAIMNRIPRGTEEINIKAFHEGIKMIKDKME